MNESITVLKCNLNGEVTWQYPGRVLRRDAQRVVLEAFFNREDVPLVDVLLRHNDRFVETFNADRGYNIFEIHDRADDALKGWYCNIARPAVITPESVSYVDLALDLWVSAAGAATVLDEDEFEALQLSAEETARARRALVELQELFRDHRPLP